MFKSGSLWRPPPINPYLHGMPEELAPKAEEPRKGQLSNNQRDKLEDLLRGLNLEKETIGEAMVFCLDHAEAAEEIVDCIAESLSILQTPIPKKIGRWFLVSDILFNSSAKVVNASFFRKYFENKLPEMCDDLQEAYKNIQQRLKAEQFKQKVIACFRSWDEWTIYPSEFLMRLQNVFLGLQSVEEAMHKEDPPMTPEIRSPPRNKPHPDDLDGAPIGLDRLNSLNSVNDDKLDGDPLDGQPLGALGGNDLDGMPLKGADFDGIPMEENNSDIDGAPIPDDKDDLDGIPLKQVGGPKAGFKMAPSKWESVDTSLLEDQAMTTSKWESLEGEKIEVDRDDDDDDDDLRGGRDDDDDYSESISSMKSMEMTEERRAKLRDIELKVMKFQDDVEGGRRSRKSGMNITEQVAKYRAKLLQKEKDKEMDKQREKEKERNREREKERLREYERARERERNRLDSDDSNDDSPAPKRRRRRSRSRSPSPPMGKRNRSESGSPSSERRSRRSSVERSPLSAIREYSDSPAHRSHGHRSRSGSPKKSGRTSRSHRSRSRSPSRRSRRSRSKSPHRSRSHKKKRKL